MDSGGCATAAATRQHIALPISLDALLNFMAWPKSIDQDPY
jgi:hypothetical protein